MLFRKDMSGYPLGTFFIAVFSPQICFPALVAVHGPHFLGYLSAARSIGQASVMRETRRTNSYPDPALSCPGNFSQLLLPTS